MSEVRDRPATAPARRRAPGGAALLLACLLSAPGWGQCFAASAASIASPLRPWGARLPAGAGSAARRGGALALRGGLEERGEEVKRVRDASREFVQGLMGEAMSKARERRAGAEDAGLGGLKSASPADNPDTDSDPISQAPIKLGFLGTGTIVGHVVCGLLRPGAEGRALSITVSPRNQAKAEELKAKFPAHVTIGANNQAVIDSSDVVCLGVTPQIVESVLAEVKFREDQLVISFLSTAKIEDISRMVAPAKVVLRAIPMPPIARGLGPLPTHPPNAHFDAIFSRAGAIIALEKEEELACMMSTSAMMATYYEFEGAAHKWLVKQGLPSVACTRYIGSLFLALATDASNQEDGFDKIVSESQTPGGINQQVITNLRQEGWFEKLGKELDLILARVTGKPKA